MKYGFAFLTACILAGGLWGQEEADPLGINARWNNGLELKTNDGNTSLKLGGRIMLDHAWFGGDSGSVDGTEFRRTRLMLSGKVNQFEWKTQYEFARGGDTTVEDGKDKGNRPAFKDVYVGVSDIPYAGALRVGHFKEPFGLEELTSSKYITFMERSLTSAFVPSRNVGLMAHRTLDNGTLAYGIFRTTGDNGFDKGDGDYSVTGRYTRLLRNDGDNLLHFGAAVSSRTLDSITIDPRPSAHLAKKALDEVADADGEFKYGIETAWVRGPLSVQAEFMASSVDGAASFSYEGWYIMGSYFLTGESRPYDSKKGTFKRVKPAQEFSWGESWGAVELAVRYGSVDYGDFVYDGPHPVKDNVTIPTNGPKFEDLTVGVNIYHNPTFRTMFNYVYSDMDGGDDVHAFMVRWQIGL